MQAMRDGDSHFEAQACLLLGQAVALESRMKLARQFSRRAHRLFERAGALGGQADALSLISYSSSVLGQDVEAINAASTSVSLRQHEQSPRTHAFGLNYLGLALSWAGDFETAASALEASMRLARHELRDAPASFQPLVNSCFLEAVRISQRHFGAHDRAGVARLEELLAQAWAMVEKGQAESLVPGVADIGLLLLDFCSCLCTSRSGRLNEADRFYLDCLERGARLPAGGWMQAMVWWARLEWMEAHGDIGKALASAHSMGALARMGEHAQLEVLARQFQARLLARLRDTVSQPAALVKH